MLLPTPEIHFFQVMKTRGLILVDNGSDMFVSGIYDPRRQERPGGGAGAWQWGAGWSADGWAGMREG